MVLRDASTIAKLVSPEGARPELAAVFDDLAATGAIVSGHFELSSGEHASHFFRFRRLAANHDALSRAADLLLARARLTPGSKVIVGPESAGALLADEIAAKLGAPLALARIDGHRRPTTEILGPTLGKQKVILVNDLSTSQAGLATMLKGIRERGGEVEHVLLFGTLDADRLATWLSEEGIRGTWLVRFAFAPKAAERCSLCRESPALPAAELN